MTLTKAIEAALDRYQNPRYKVRYDKMRDDYRYEVFRYGEDADEPEIVIYSRYEHEGDADHAMDEANLEDVLLAALPDQPMTEDELVGLIASKVIGDVNGVLWDTGTDMCRDIIRALKAANVLYVEDK
jgi:hypothetical protein